ncbi:ABC transporter permease subunit [Telmatocola sphagniphila]|uniref:ABC transporter permease subunit n=1 Tax=Telmatocola sphagniphila TaxID=1123043 RepID=A0A8E6B9K9_9BACT|nr:ABC transporter permease subunit [Telmatocola sphagniphila]QVL33666.1 ABC transporter permease subunit [Telmatocola sphagniphila]
MNAPAQSHGQQGAGLLRYRPWRGTFRGPLTGVWAIARGSLTIIFRRKLFWWLFGLATLTFLFYFFGQYLQVFIEQKITDGTIRVGGLFQRQVNPEIIMKSLRDGLQLNGTADTYANLIWFEGYIVLVIMAFTGSICVGNDFLHGSLPFYLSKPIHRWHYILGKALAIAILINLMTTLPALALYIEYGFIESWEYYFTAWRLLLGILIYGGAITIVLGSLLLALASWLRKTVPLVMIWTTLFILGKALASWFVDGLKLSERWRLFDLWNDLYLLGHWSFGSPPKNLRPSWQMQPQYHEAALVLAAVTLVCCFYLHRRIRAIEVIV